MRLRGLGREFAVHVFHDPPLTELRRMFNISGEIRRGTHVTMHEGQCHRIALQGCMSEGAEASAMCSEKDNFERCKGRKIALGRAMLALLPGPEHQQLRTALWEDFRMLTREIPSVV